METPVWINEMTWQEFEQYVETEDHPTVIVPIDPVENCDRSRPPGIPRLAAHRVPAARTSSGGG